MKRDRIIAQSKKTEFSQPEAGKRNVGKGNAGRGKAGRENAGKRNVGDRKGGRREGGKRNPGQERRGGHDRDRGSITMRAYAKINLSLDVLRRLPTGYHQVEMVMQAVDLYDKVTVEWERLPAGEGPAVQRVEVSSNLPYLPVGEDNIACKAARLMLRTFKPDEPAFIRICMEKHIPVAAGLAGGSADGAAVLRALSRLWGLYLGLNQICGLGEQLGSDVPFCVWAQEGLTCALARGLGTELSSLPPLDSLVLLSKPPISVSTAKVYGGLRLDAIPEGARPQTSQVMEGLERGDMGILSGAMSNVLETVTLSQFPRVLELKKQMIAAGGADAVLMSGSGPTVFGLYSSERAARRACAVMRRRYRETYLRRTLL